MITEIAEIIVRELGPTGLLILAVGFFAQKAFFRLDIRIKKVNEELAILIGITKEKLELEKKQTRHG